MYTIHIELISGQYFGSFDSKEAAIGVLKERGWTKCRTSSKESPLYKKTGSADRRFLAAVILSPIKSIEDIP